MSQPATPRPARLKPGDPNTPQRRSLYELQRLIDEVFDDFSVSGQTHAADDAIVAAEDGSRTCRAKDLPAILSAFEDRRQIVLLDEGGLEQLQAFSQQHPDLDVSSEQLVTLLSAMSSKPPVADSPSAVGLMNKQLPTPPPSELESEDDSAPLRSRTLSSSSRSSSSGDSTMLTGSGTLDDGAGDAVGGSLFDAEPNFPRSHSMPVGMAMASPPGTPIAAMYQRSQTSHDLRAAACTSPDSGIPRPTGARRSLTGGALQHTPLSATIAARQRSSPLEAPTESSLRRARPAPPKSRRISADRDKFTSTIAGSSSTTSMASMDGRRSRQSSEELASPRDFSSPREALTSPLFATSLEAMTEEGDSSFEDLVASRSRSRTGSYTRGASPLFDTSPPPQAGPERAMFPPPPQSPLLDDTSFHSIPISPNELQRGVGDFSLHSRPVSMASVGSEAAMAEMIQVLQQELARKTQDLEAQRADNYSALMEKEALLEEIRTELIAKRKEEKELRGKEKINLNQIATLEAQTATFSDDRDKQKNAYQSARKQYEEQCNESEKLRNTIRSKDEEVRIAEENLQNSLGDIVKINRERDYLQSQVTRLEEEVNQARQTAEHLEEQKNENLQLKETIDRLRLDLDELRAQAKVVEAKASSSSLSRSASGTESVPGTLSRNLGRELARRLGADESLAEDQEDQSEAGNDTYEEEEIITTRRRMLQKRPVMKKVKVDAKDDGLDNSGQGQETLVSVEVCDVMVQATPPEVVTSDIKTQTEPEIQPSPEEKRQTLAKDLGVNLSVVDEFIRLREERLQAERTRLVDPEPETAPPPYHSTPVQRLRPLQAYTGVVPRDLYGLYQLAVASSGNFLLYSVVLFLSGLLTGSTLLPVRHHHHFGHLDNYANWVAFNSIEAMQGPKPGGWKESAVFWLEEFIWRGVAISRRVPT